MPSSLQFAWTELPFCTFFQETMMQLTITVMHLISLSLLYLTCLRIRLRLTRLRMIYVYVCNLQFVQKKCQNDSIYLSCLGLLFSTKLRCTLLLFKTEYFIFANSIKRHICDVRNSRLAHYIPTVCVYQ